MSYHLALGLEREPFSNSPDPDLLYRAKSHLECLQHMEIAVRLRRGLNVVLGEVGTGKTTLGRELVRILGADPDIEVHFLDDPYHASPVEFLEALCRLFAIDPAPLGRDAGLLREALKSGLLARSADGRRIVALIVDEGQKITPECLELLRELLNFETNTHKLLQIVMFAQTEFEDVLAARPNLDDRVNFRYRLLPLDRRQTRRMIETRLTLCAPNGQAPAIFTPLAMRRIHRLTRGYPRKIVRLCHLSMLLAVGYGKARIGWGLVGRAARDARSGPGLWLRRAALAGGFAAAVAAGYSGLVGPGLSGLEQKALDLYGQGRAYLAAAMPPVAPQAVAVAPDTRETPVAADADLAAAPETAPVADIVDIGAPAAPMAEAPAAALALAKAPGQPATAASAAAPAVAPAPVAANTFAAPPAASTRVLPENPVAAHASGRTAGEAAAAPAAAAPHITSPGLGAALELASAALPPDAKEQVIVVTTEDGLPAMPQPVGQLAAPPVLPATPLAAPASAVAAPGASDRIGEASVRPGWALSRLAARIYGNGGRPVLSAIAKANPGVDMARLRAGEFLVYPAIAAKAPPAGSCLVKLASADSLEQGLTIIARAKDRNNLSLSLFCTKGPGAQARFDVVLTALFPDQAQAQTALAALPPDLAARATLLTGFPEGTTYYTDLGESRGDIPVRPRSVVGRQVAESRPVAGVVRPLASPAEATQE